MKHCESCQRPSERIRRGLCDACYYADYKGKTKKSYCECCNWQDRRALVRKRLDRENWSTVCGNCATIAGRRVLTLDELRAEVIPEGDRRQQDRRTGEGRRDLSKPRRSGEDPRFYEREEDESSQRRKDERRD